MTTDLEIQAVGKNFVDRWMNYCRTQLPVPLSDQLANDGGAGAAFTIYDEAILADHVGTLTADMIPDPTTLLWFGNAVALTVSDEANNTYAALVKFVDDSDTRKETLDAALAHLFARWSGVAAQACNDFARAITNFIELQRDSATELANLIAAVRSAVMVAIGSTDGDPAVNGSLSACMSALVKAVNQKTAAVGQAEHDEFIKDMQSLVTLALSTTSAGMSGGAKGAVSLASAVWSFGKDAYNNGQAVIEADSDWPALLDSYLGQAREQRDKVGDMIAGSILKSAQAIKLSDPPQLPNISTAQIGYDDK
jgi:hypothetical protein